MADIAAEIVQLNAQRAEIEVSLKANAEEGDLIDSQKQKNVSERIDLRKRREAISRLLDSAHAKAAQDAERQATLTARQEAEKHKAEAATLKEEQAALVEQTKIDREEVAKLKAELVAAVEAAKAAVPVAPAA